MNKKQRGFTLIELMIVIAIIGILVAIALPTYNNYLIRSRVSEAVAAMDTAKVAVAESYASNSQTLPGSNQLAGLGTAASYATTYLATLTVGANGVISAVTTAATGTAAMTITLTPTANANGTLIWACTVSTPATNDQYVPANCRT